VFRLVQGAGAAFLFANGTALVTDAFPATERGFALGINLTVGVSGFLLGTVLGGVITHYLGWRYIFFLNLPFGIFATMWTYTTLREIVPPERTARFDIGGMVTFPLGMASILAGLTQVVMGRASGLLPRALFTCGGVMLLAFFLIERRAPEPMMDLGLFRIRMFLAGNLSLFLNALSRGATMFVMSWYFQAVRKDSPLAAGWKLMPWALAMMALSPIAGRLSDRFGSRGISTAGLIVVCGSQVWLTRLPVDIRYGPLGLALAALGAGHGIFNSPNTSAVMGSVPPNRRGVAAGTRTLLNNSGQTLAIALAMVVLSTVMSYRVLTDLFAGAARAGPSLNGLEFMRAFHQLFALSAVITLAAIASSSLRGREDQGGAPPVGGNAGAEGGDAGCRDRVPGGGVDPPRSTLG
jgi:MFS family permease